MGNHVTDRPATLKQRWAIVSDVLVPALFDAPITHAGADAILKAKNKSKRVAGDVLGSIGIRLANKHPAADLIEEYFHKVYGYTLDLSGVAFPEQEGFPTWMASPEELDEDKILESLGKHFKVPSYSWKTPIVENIDRVKEQRRPSGLYVFAHRGGDEPDDIHRNKSYDRSMAEKFPFANLKEYLLMTGFHGYVKGYLMDRKGWTRTSSLWANGYLVCGFWYGADAGFCLGSGHRGRTGPEYGPRELFLGNFSL